MRIHPEVRSTLSYVAAFAMFGVACTDGGTSTDGGAGTDDPDLDQAVTVRVVSWNVQGLGSPSSTQGLAERATLARIDADIVGLNEIDDDDFGRLDELAEDLGYDTVFVPGTNPFGGLRNAVMTRLPVREVVARSSRELSGDAQANDVTRHPIRLVVEVPDSDASLTVVVNHLKSGFDLTDAFRRTLDGVRTAQAAAEAEGPRLILGDMNAELEDMPETPPTWTYTPNGLPRDYQVGTDQRAVIRDGLPNSAFAAMEALSFIPLDAVQVDGRPDTRPVSNRRIDWIFVSPEIADGVRGEVYDSTDEGQGSGLPKSGEPAARSVSADASDHLPIFVDVELPRSP